MSLKESRAGLVVVGAVGEGEGELGAASAGLGELECVGVVLAVLFWPAQPVVRTRTASKTVEKRTRKG